MAKRLESGRAGWGRNSSVTKATAGVQRPAIAQAAGVSEDHSPTRSDIHRMGPYETSYQIDRGYTGRETV